MGAMAFLKMHGLGNDFVVVDARGGALRLDGGTLRALADRRTGIGCDQVIVIEPSARADAFMRIYNADGGEVAACGNATRCVARLLMDESGKASALIETRAGLLATRPGPAAGLVTVDMGEPGLDWRQIPLASAQDTLRLDLAQSGLAGPAAVSMGNPHMVFFVPDAEAVALAEIGPGLEHHPLYPEKANVELVTVKARDHLRMRVWERGAGITQACGTGACAALVAAARRGLADRRARVEVDGGILDIAWGDDNHVLMTGPAALAFRGQVDPAALAAGGRAA